MTSMSCIVKRLSTYSKDSRILLIAGPCWPRGNVIHKRTSRGVSTDTPTEEPPLEEDNSLEVDRINEIRNVSRLNRTHRCIVNSVAPEERTLPHHFTVLYNRRLFGKYGYASGVNPSLCWPTKAELDEKKEFEKVSYPYTIKEIAEREWAKHEAEEKAIFARDAQVAENYKKMLVLKEEYLAKQERVKAEAQAAKAFKLRLIEEVRLHFNYTVNERDDRFKLELKERAKQLREKQKLEKKTLKKEKQAVEKVTKNEALLMKLRKEEEDKARKIRKSAEV